MTNERYRSRGEKQIKRRKCPGTSISRGNKNKKSGSRINKPRLLHIIDDAD